MHLHHRQYETSVATQLFGRKCTQIAFPILRNPLSDVVTLERIVELYTNAWYKKKIFMIGWKLPVKQRNLKASNTSK